MRNSQPVMQQEYGFDGGSTLLSTADNHHLHSMKIVPLILA